MSKLVIVESPAKAKTIEKYLGKEYTVKSSVGHIRDLPKSNKKAIDIEGGFIPHYEIKKEKKAVVKELKEATAKASEVILATDPDREGEAIAWHLKELLGLKKPKRIVFHEITEEAVKEAIKNPREIDNNLKEAQEARRVLDRLVGYDLSGLIWKKVRYGLSAGRVQSPALRILAEKEREINKFIPEKYWVITADVETNKKNKFTVTLDKEPKEESEVNEILEKAKVGNWSVLDIEQKEAKRQPRPPFTTSTIQQRASSLLGFSPSRTMRAAQKLYESGLITYMRTDSTNISKGAQSQIYKEILKTYGEKYAQNRVYSTKSKNAQEAHEAIRPTNVSVKVAGKTEDEKKLYELIRVRTISSQMTDAKILRTKIITSADKTIPTFSINGSQTLFDGWLKVNYFARGEDVELPKVEKSESLSLIEINPEGKETTPPPRYTEAGLVKELEKRGIGRPSTYASIIKTIVDRGYVDKEGRSLKPTDTGMVVSGFLEENFNNYISDSFTAEMEDELDEIALGKRGYKKTLEDFYGDFSKEVKIKSKDAKKITDLGPAPKEFKCPKCDKDMVIKLGRAGNFMSCSNFPECHGARTITGEELKDDEPLGKDPETGENIYLLDGPYGPYVQLGEKSKGKKPKRASLPEDKKPEDITLEDAIKWLSLPRLLGKNPETGKDISASIGRFGPYIVEDGDFRSIKEDDPYTITLEKALEILKEPKKTRRRAPSKKKK